MLTAVGKTEFQRAISTPQKGREEPFKMRAICPNESCDNYLK